MHKSIEQIQAQFFSDLISEDASDTVGASKGFEVYRYAYRARLRESIEEDFPVSLERLGSEVADQLFARFFAESGSTTFTLNALSEDYLKFIEAKDFPTWFVALSRFEWLLTKTRFVETAPEAIPARALQLSEDPPARLQPAEALCMQSFDYPVDEIYRDQTVSETSRATSIVFWRHDGDVKFDAISDFEAHLLELVRTRISWEAVEEGLLEKMEDQANLAETLQAAMVRLASLGILKLS